MLLLLAQRMLFFTKVLTAFLVIYHWKSRSRICSLTWNLHVKSLHIVYSLFDFFSFFLQFVLDILSLHETRTKSVSEKISDNFFEQRMVLKHLAHVVIKREDIYWFHVIRSNLIVSHEMDHFFQRVCVRLLRRRIGWWCYQKNWRNLMRIWHVQ